MAPPRKKQQLDHNTPTTSMEPDQSKEPSKQATVRTPPPAPPPSGTPTPTTLTQRIASLPQELQDQIINLTFSIPCAETLIITTSWLPPPILNATKRIREELWPTFFGENSFCLVAPGDFWPIYEKWSACKSFFPEGYEEVYDDDGICTDGVQQKKEEEEEERKKKQRRKRAISEIVADAKRRRPVEKERGNSGSAVNGYRSGITPWTTVYRRRRKY
ncbi:hypothetical protein CERZMDRAFT_102861 [Cercospora zeae-maydis SCOH1-5]|uniref:Uncharacterized protein n=1 Tax=Cercospora zeae-maydis SCOH1-5 TaxID=717836 RepID=A0A6A6EZU9_9PEZI|nr:hypothetical protein CERZMDRAFT_102861 [Cercospora zeae-maydis SCOH1-5]